MKKTILIFLFVLLSLPLFASGQTEGTVPGSLASGIEQYESGNLEQAASEFKQAASGGNAETAAAAYYNYGTVQAELAQQAQDPEQKRTLLEDSYEALRRAAELDRLPAAQENQARRNMEIVREQISELPEPPPEGRENDKQDQSGDGQEGQDGPSSQNGRQQVTGDGQSGSAGGEAQSPQDMLEQQRNLSERTENGSGSELQLSQQQKELQKASEEAGLNEAAINQAKAARALDEGDRKQASEYQKAAEESLQEAVKAEEEADGGSEAEDILNQEAENDAQRNRLDETGGITDADRNW